MRQNVADMGLTRGWNVRLELHRTVKLVVVNDEATRTLSATGLNPTNMQTSPAEKRTKANMLQVILARNTVSSTRLWYR